MRLFRWVAGAASLGFLLACASGASAQDGGSEEPEAGYDKGYFIHGVDGRFALKTNTSLQVQARGLSLDADDGRETRAAFLIRRGRLTLSGHALKPELHWKFQAGFDGGTVSLKDYYLDYEAVPGWLRLRAGQWKRPFSRQQMVSGSRQELVDRSITNNAFGAGRDIGVAVHNGTPDGFEYALGLFNGTGDKAAVTGDVLVDPVTGEGEITGVKIGNVPPVAHPALVLRLGYNHGGIKGYSEADLEGGPLRWALAGSGQVDFDADDDGVSNTKGELDFSLKVHGFSATGAYYGSTVQGSADFTDQNYLASGFHVQAGYVIADHYQPAVRFAQVARDGADNDEREVAGAFSIYFFKHSLKWQTDVAVVTLEGPAADRDDVQVRTQLQLAL